MEVVYHMIDGDQINLKNEVDGAHQHDQTGKNPGDPDEIFNVFHKNQITGYNIQL